MVEAAKKLLSRESAIEKALILAVQHRYPFEHVPEDLMDPTWADAKAMKIVYEFGNGNVDVAAIIRADQLRSLAPDAGHAHYMPSHIDVFVGDYLRAIDTNLKATAADNKYYAKEGPRNFYTLYRLHNYHSLIYAAMLAEQPRVALKSVDRMDAAITDEMLLSQSPPMADWLESFNTIRTHVYICFGMWNELKTQSVPDNRELYRRTIAMVYYGRALEYAATGLIDESLSARKAYLAAAKQVPYSTMIFPNTVVDVLGVAVAGLVPSVGGEGLALNVLVLSFVHGPSLIEAKFSIANEADAQVIEHDHGHDHGHSHDHDDHHNDHIHGSNEARSSADAASEDHKEHKHNNATVKPHGRDLGMLGVFVHVLGDAFNNIGVIIAAVVMWKAEGHERYYIDPVISVLIAVTILISTIPLTKNSGSIMLQMAPDGVQLEDVKRRSKA
ncbi:hypothetical protein LZL87_013609 [Fusarium oxysporum]|nr:hypothetical protein LZL87_013609 [Fusarium oxysporum]